MSPSQLLSFLQMFIRKKLNKNGSVAVMLLGGERVPGKKHPVSRMIKHFGSASEESQIDALVQEAETYKANFQTIPKAKILRIACDTDLQSCRSYNVGFSDVYGELFADIFSSLALKTHFIRQLQVLTVMRIAAPASKLKTARFCEEYGFDSKVDVLYKLMDQLTPAVIERIKQIIHHYTCQILLENKQSIDVLFYDLTTISFETSTQDEVRNFGFSKDGKHQHVQIMLAVMVTKEGLPIDYEEFPGNCYEGHTLLPVIKKIQQRYQINKAILVADAALMNKVNLQELTASKIHYVIAARIKNTKRDVKQSILDLSTYKNVSSTRDPEGILEDEIKAKRIEMETGDWLIVYHSSRRARKDKWDREKDLQKIKNYLASTGKSKLTSRLKKSYVFLKKDCAIEIDPQKLKQEEAYDGFFGLQTNIKNAIPKELLSSYRGLWQVEQTFRISKSHLKIRPVFHYSPRRIRAHFAVCYMALALVRYREFKLKRNQLFISYEQLHELLDRMRVVKIINSEKQQFELLEGSAPELFSIYQVLGIPWRRKFEHSRHLL